MVTKCEINEKALVISSKSYSVRAMVTSSKTFFSIVDILSACGIEAPRKWVERNLKKYAWCVIDIFAYPTKTVKGWRMNKVQFVTAGIAKRVISYTSCPDPIRTWLLEEVFTYRPKVQNTEPQPVDREVDDELCDSRNVTYSQQHEESFPLVLSRTASALNDCGKSKEQAIRMIDDIILNALELDRKEYGDSIDKILLGLLDLKRLVIRNSDVYRFGA